MTKAEGWPCSGWGWCQGRAPQNNARWLSVAAILCPQQRAVEMSRNLNINDGLAAGWGATNECVWKFAVMVMVLIREMGSEVMVLLTLIPLDSSLLAVCHMLARNV